MFIELYDNNKQTENLDLSDGKYSIDIDSCQCEEPPAFGLSEDSQAKIVYQAKETKEYKIVSFGNWPEFKTRTCYKRIFGVKVPYPCIYRRTCRKTFYCAISYNQIESKILKSIEDCIMYAIPVVVPIVISGQISLAVTTFSNLIEKCLVVKGITNIPISISIDSHKECTEWKKI